MKKTLIALSTVLILSSCSKTVTVSNSSQGVNTISQGDISKLNREDIKIGSNVEGMKTWSKAGILFFMFGSNGGNESSRREKLYLKVCKDNKYDGILQPKYETKRFMIPLIVVNYVQYKTYLTGKGYVIKTDIK